MKEQTEDFVMQELEARRQALWALLESYPAEAHKVFLVKPAEVKAAIDALDDEAILAQFRESILIPENCGGIRYEWYYDGDPESNVAEGYGFKDCELNEFSESDLVEIPGGPYLEREEPELSGACDEDDDGEGSYSGHIDVNLVMHPWYSTLSPRYDDADYTGIENTPLHLPFNDAQDIYNELFRIKMYMLVNRTLSAFNIADMPYVFMSLHERWPVLVYAPPSAGAMRKLIDQFNNTETIEQAIPEIEVYIKTLPNNDATRKQLGHVFLSTFYGFIYELDAISDKTRDWLRAKAAEYSPKSLEELVKDETICLLDYGTSLALGAEQKKRRATLGKTLKVLDTIQTPIKEKDRVRSVVNNVIHMINDGEYDEAIAIIWQMKKLVLTDTDMQRLLAQGIALGTYKNNQALINFSLEQVPEKITWEVLAFNLACRAATLNHKADLIKYTTLARQCGKPVEAFKNDSDFAPFKTDPDFLAALETQPNAVPKKKGDFNAFENDDMDDDEFESLLDEVFDEMLEDDDEDNDDVEEDDEEDEKPVK